MAGRRARQVAVLAWATLGAAIAWSSIGDVNADARVFVGTASAVGPALAVVAAVALGGRSHARVAGLLLVASAVVTPTYFAWPLSLAALVAGIALALTQRNWSSHRSRGEPIRRGDQSVQRDVRP